MQQSSIWGSLKAFPGNNEAQHFADWFYSFYIYLYGEDLTYFREPVMRYVTT